jgi:hypothetical protein
MKRGQVTVAMILVLVVLLGVALLLWYVGTSLSGASQTRAADSGSVSDYISECLTITSQEALEVFGEQGGSIVLADPYFEDLTTAYLYDGANKVPSVSEAEMHLGMFVDSNIDRCLNDFSDFEGVKVKRGSPSTTVSINKDDVVFRLKYPITISKGDKKITIEESIATEELNLNTVLWLANTIVNSQINYGMVDIDAIKSDLDVTLYPYEKTLITHITDASYTKVNNEPYLFRFANKDIS